MKKVGGVLLIVVMVLVAYGLGTMTHEETSTPQSDVAEEIDNFYCGVDEVEETKGTQGTQEKKEVTPLSEREATARSVGYSWETPMSVIVEK